MVFIGFGFLMTYLKRYAYGAIGLNFFLSALVIQWDVWVEREWIFVIGSTFAVFLIYHRPTQRIQ